MEPAGGTLADVPNQPTSATASPFEPPPGFGPGALFVQEPRPLDGAVLLRHTLCVTPPLCAALGGIAAGYVVFSVGLFAVVFGPLAVWPAVRDLRLMRIARDTPDVVGVDARGVLVRCEGRRPFQVPWRHVRRLDAGAGRDAGWLRLWITAGVTVEEIERLPRRRRTTEDATLVVRFGDGVDRGELGEALRRFAPPGVRTRL